MNDFENLTQLNKTLKNKIFAFRSEDDTSTQQSVNEDDEKQTVIVVSNKIPTLQIEFIQVAESWMKLKLKSGITYLFDSEVIGQMMEDKYNEFMSIDFKQYENLISNKVSQSDDPRMKACYNNTVVFRSMPAHISQHCSELAQFFKSMFEGLEHSDMAYVTESIQSQIVDRFNLATDGDGNALQNDDIIVLLVNGFPMAFYTDFTISSIGNVQFYKAIDPIAWYGIRLNAHSENLDDKNCAL